MVGMFEKVVGAIVMTSKWKETLEANIPNLQKCSSVDTRSKNPNPDSDWVISIKKRLEDARENEVSNQWAKLSIYRVPKRLRGGDAQSYIPQIVSIGPYHHDRERFKEMENHKWRALYHMLYRTNQDITVYLNSIKKVEKQARVCYEGKIKPLSHEFIEIMVLDGCFILELFRGTIEGFQNIGYSSSDPIFSIRGIMYFLQRDLIMLENQLPLFILDRLLGLQIGMPKQKGRVAKLALEFFNSLMLTGQEKLESSLENEIKFDPLLQELHLIDVYRRSLLGTGPQVQPPPPSEHFMKRQQLIYSVTELREAGINFKMRKTDRFWDIKFKCGKLWIPRLVIHDSTKSLLLNLIAFEQCHLGCSNHITSYVIFMDNLINSPEDIRYLHYCGIIEHCLGSDEEVADLFNSLCQEVVFDFNDSYLSDISNQITSHCDNCYNTCCAALKHNYFNNPWAFISVIAATVLLLLTIAQTFYTVYGYYKPIS